MNRNQRLDLILKTLLLPFIDETFCEEDLIAQRAACVQDYQNLVHKETYKIICNRLISCVSQHVRPDRLDDVIQLLNAFYPEREIAHWLPKGETHCRADLYYFKRILDISDNFVTLRNGRLSIRLSETPNRDELFGAYSGLHKAELWNLLCRIVTPDLFIAGYFVSAEIRDVWQLSHLAPNLSMSDALLSRILQRGMAETHLHAGAGMSYLSVWEQCTDFIQLQGWADFQVSDLWQGLPIQIATGTLRLMMASYLESKQCSAGIPIIKFYSDKYHKLERDILQSWVLGNVQDNWKSWWESVKYKKQDFCLYFFNNNDYALIRQNHSLDSDLLGRSIYKKYRKICTPNEIIFLYQSLFYLKKTKNPQYARVLFQYIRLKNLFFQHNMQTPGILGLRNFQGYYNRSSSAAYTGRDKTTQKNQFFALFCDQGKCPGLQKLELKISPYINIRIISNNGLQQESLHELKVGISYQLLSIFKVYREYLNSFSNDSEKKMLSFPNIGIVFHFIKKEDLGRIDKKTCWLSEMDKQIQESEFIETQRKRMMFFLDALVQLLHNIPYLNEYVVGIDAASDELGMEPWILAPVFLHARRRGNTNPWQKETKRPIQNLGLTYHVGEDYRHLLSGLRHIDEVLTYFGYKAGDRLGHALAVQISPQKWQSDNEVVALPIMEYLEDLLWLQDLSNREPEIKSCIPLNLDDEIMDLAQKIYDNIIGITPYVLWETYIKKFSMLDHQMVEQVKENYMKPFYKSPMSFGITNDTLLNHSHPEVRGSLCQSTQVNLQRCFCQQYRRRPGVDHVWDSDKLLLTHFCPIYTECYNQPIFVQVPENQVALFCKVQEYLKRRIQKAGIFVETNPTSNATIGDIHGILENPVLNLNSKEFGGNAPYSVLLTVNSDDPLVFNTNIENEFANTYYALLKLGYSREETLAWIDKIRQYGIDSSFIHNVKEPRQIDKELKRICDALDVFIKQPPGKDDHDWNAFYPNLP